MHHIFLKCGLSSFAVTSSAPSRGTPPRHSPAPPCARPAPARSSAPARPAAGYRPERSAALHRPVCADRAGAAGGGSKPPPALFDKALTNPLDRRHAHPHRLGDLGVDPARPSLALIGVEQDTAMGQPPGRTFVARD